MALAGQEKALTSVRDKTAAKVDGALKRRRVSSLDRILQIWDYLDTIGEPCTAYALAKAVGAPLSTIYSTIEELVERDLLARNSVGAIWLGPRLHRYGLAYARAIDFLQIATEEMSSLCNLLGETIQICGRDKNEMVVMAMAEGVGHYRVTSNIGSRLPIRRTASGRLLVGWMGEVERREILGSNIKRSASGDEVIDVEELSDGSRKAFKERLAIQVGESEVGVACIASPIVNNFGVCDITISIVVPQFKLQDNIDRYSTEVRNSANLIERRLGWRQ